MHNELKCPCCGLYIENEELDNKLEELFLKLGKLPISSGTRCASHNEEIGGKPHSLHLVGKAVDIPTSNVDEVARVASELGFNGIGIYKHHVHLDVREFPTMWRG